MLISDFYVSSHLNVKMFGAVGDGVNDDTAAIQAAIDTFSAGKGSVWFPQGTYKVTSTITVAQDRIHLLGAGVHSTTINFVPTGDDTCIECSKGASVIYQGSIRDMAFISSDTTYNKVAINVIDGSGYVVENIASTSWSGGGAGSTGIQVNGREFGLFRNLYIGADRPLVIGTNPNSAAIGIDQHHFPDCYFTGKDTDAYPIVEILDDVVLTQVTFDGAQAWVNGSYGLYWNYTGSVVSNGLQLENVRWEGQSNASGYLVYLNRTTAYLNNVYIKSCYGGLDINGFYLRLIDRVTLDHVYYVSSTLKGIDFDSAVGEVILRNCLWQTGSTATIAGHTLVSCAPYITGATYNTATWTSASSKVIFTNCKQGSEAVTLVDNAVLDLTPYLSTGILIVTDNHETAALIQLMGSNHTTHIMSNPDGNYTAAAGSDGYANVYWSAGNSRYELENKFGATHTFRLTMLGS